MDATTSKILAVFLQHFEPAIGLAEADEQLSTEQLHEKIVSFYPDAELSYETLFAELANNGFKYEWIQDEFKWLLKEKA